MTDHLIINDFTYQINAPKQDVTHHLSRINGFKRINNFGKLSFQYDFQRNYRLEFDVRRGEDKDNASLDLKLDTHTLEVRFGFKFNGCNTSKNRFNGAISKQFCKP